MLGAPHLGQVIAMIVRACGDPSPGLRPPSPRKRARDNSNAFGHRLLPALGEGKIATLFAIALLPACGEKVAEGRMRGSLRGNESTRGTHERGTLRVAPAQHRAKGHLG